MRRIKSTKRQEEKGEKDEKDEYMTKVREEWDKRAKG